MSPEVDLIQDSPRLPLFVFSIMGQPGFKQRARQGRKLRAGKVITYTPKKTRDYEKKVQMEFLRKYPHPIKSYGPLVMLIDAYFPMTLKAVNTLRDWQDTIGHEDNITQKTSWDFVDWAAGKISKPDWDNIGKVISDALNGLAYRDDSQLVKVMLSKYWWWGHEDQSSVWVRIYEHDARTYCRDEDDYPLIMEGKPLQMLREMIRDRRIDRAEIKKLNNEE